MEELFKKITAAAGVCGIKYDLFSAGLNDFTLFSEKLILIRYVG